MKKHVALLRGINVGGHRIVKMDRLKSFFESLDFQNVSTYIQSGNVIFESPIDDSIFICNIIKTGFKEVFDFEVPVTIRKIEELEELLNKNPYVEKENWESRVHLTFLSDEPTELVKDTMELKDNADEICIMDREIFLYCPMGYRTTKYSNNYLEKKLSVSATTRNWKTISKIISLAKK